MSDELVKRLSVEEVVMERDKALALFAEGIRILEQANFHVQRAGGEYAGLSMQIGEARIYRKAHGEEEDLKPRYVEELRREIDEHVWHYLKKESGLGSLMDRKASQDFDEQLKKSVPEVTLGNVLATFGRLNEEKEIIWERGVVNVFRGLSRKYRNNDEFRIGRKVILNAYGGIYGRISEELADLDRIFHVLDGKEPKDNVSNASSQLRAHWSWNGKHAGVPLVTEYLTMTCYKKGSIHIVFNRADLVDKVNVLIARATGGDSKLAERKAKRAGGVSR